MDNVCFGQLNAYLFAMRAFGVLSDSFADDVLGFVNYCRHLAKMGTSVVDESVLVEAEAEAMTLIRYTLSK